MSEKENKKKKCKYEHLKWCDEPGWIKTMEHGQLCEATNFDV